MKKTKKLAALVLALAMAFSLMAVTAAAYGHEDEGIMPMYEVVRCPRCGGAAEYQERGPIDGKSQRRKVCLDTVTCGYVSPWVNI